MKLFTILMIIITMIFSMFINNVAKARTPIHGLMQDKYGLIMFYSSACPNCQAESPRLKAWSYREHVDILPISMNGGVLPAWKNETLPSNGRSKYYGIKSTDTLPILILFNGITKQTTILSHGIIELSDLENRIKNEIKNEEK